MATVMGMQIRGLVLAGVVALALAGCSGAQAGPDGIGDAGASSVPAAGAQDEDGGAPTVKAGAGGRPAASGGKGGAPSGAGAPGAGGKPSAGGSSGAGSSAGAPSAGASDGGGGTGGNPEFAGAASGGSSNAGAAQGGTATGGTGSAGASVAGTTGTSGAGGSSTGGSGGASGASSAGSGGAAAWGIPDALACMKNYPDPSCTSAVADECLCKETFCYTTTSGAFMVDHRVGSTDGSGHPDCEVFPAPNFIPLYGTPTPAISAYCGCK